MKRWMLAGLLSCASLADAVELRLDLADGLKRQRLSIEIDGVSRGTLSVDAGRSSARLQLGELAAPSQRYRITGEGESLDGERFKIAGAGLLVREVRMNAIDDAAALAAIQAYRALVAEIKAAAPGVDLAALELTQLPPPPASAFAQAEDRLGRKLPVGYQAFVARHGSLRLGPAAAPSGQLYGPAELGSLKDYTLGKAREMEVDPKAVAKFIDRYFRQAGEDLVLGVWEGESPSVVRSRNECPSGELAYAYPESQWEVLTGAGLDGNAFVAMIDYESEIVGESICNPFERELAWSLHDHLIEIGADVFYWVADEEQAVSLTQSWERSGEGSVWLRFTEVE